MGEVFLAQDTKPDRKVALKILPPEFADDKDRMSRFVREAKSASALNHPNIITIYEIGESNGTHFIATEFIDGKTLSDYQKANPLSYKSALEIAIQVASALDEAHHAGIVHRDIKPDNVMIRSNGLAKILDFGIAKVTATVASDEEAATAILALTQAGMIIGTPNYMSPEQARGKDVDHQADIFSFGVVFYEMLSGNSPFSGETVSDVIAAVLTKEPKRLSEIPPELEQILNKTLEKDKKNRYQTAKDLLTDLQEAKEELSIQSRLEKTSSPNIEEPKTQILQAVTTAETDSNKSIAVLPFTNMSADEDNEYFCEGLAEELLNALSKINDLKVAARTSAFFFKGKETDIREVGEKLNVTSVLEGSVRKTETRLRISVQLIDVTNGFQVWTEQYDRQPDDVLAIQEEIAREIAEKLQLKLTGKEKELLISRPTENPVAYRNYLKGRYYWNRFTEEGFRKAVEQFELALEEEPSYGQAYSGLADSYIELGFFSYVSPHNAFPKAKAAAKKALAIDPGMAEARFSMAHCSFYYEWNWEDAEHQYKRAIELAPREPTGRQKYGFFLATMGRFDEALQQLKIAQEVDPLSPFYATSAAIVLLHARRAEEGIEICRELLNDHPKDAWTRWVFAWHLQILGEFETAVAHARTAYVDSGENSQFLAVLGHAYGLNGQRDEAQKVLEQLKERKTRSHTSPFLLALVCAGLGQKDDAFQYLNEAFDERAGWMVWLRSYPPLDTICEDTRYKDLSSRVGLD